MDFIKINEKDNVCVSLENGHKYALTDIKKGDTIVKYGFPIGVAYQDICKGEHIHTHNLKTSLGKLEEYTYSPKAINHQILPPVSISAYVRENGDIGIRNDIWIINTVGCINKTSQKLSQLTGAFYFPHPYGCSQLGKDHLTTQQILCNLIKHPNAGGVLVLGLGCENNNISQMKKALGDYNEKRVRFLNVQDCEDELEEGVRIIRELEEQAKKDVKVNVPASKLKIGLKCGGSDGLSGITANSLIGKVCDRFVNMGGCAVLTEVPEMFGAEQLLMDRAENREVFDKIVRLINDFKQYFISNNQPVSENPSPGNKDGGITTLEEKSLGCVQKGGTSVITDVLDYGDIAQKSGLNLLNGSGNDIVAITNLTACGCHLILFSTGRATPLGAPVPTIKISSNTQIALRKKNWIDFDAGRMLNSHNQNMQDELFSYILSVANGTQTKNEINSYREIAIFKSGITM